MEDGRSMKGKVRRMKERKRGDVKGGGWIEIGEGDERWKGLKIEE